MKTQLAVTIMPFLFITADCVIEVEIACPGFVDTATGTVALAFTGPAFELAVEEVNRQYAGILRFTLTYLYETNGSVTSLPDTGAFLLSRWYYTQRQYPDGLAFVLSPAILDVTTVHQLVDSWNSLYMQTGLQARSQYNITNAAPILSTSSSRTTSVARVMASFVTLFNFTTVFIVTDIKNSPFDSKITFDECLLSLATVRNMSIHSRQFAAEVYEKSRQSYHPLLDQLASLSRVMIFLGRPDHLRRLLIDASSRDMTKGDYIYLTILPGPFQPPAMFGNISWQYEDGHDSVAKTAFRSLIIFQEHLENPTEASLLETRQLLREIRQRARLEFGIAYQEKDQPSRPLKDCYATVIMLAQVLNDTLSRYGERALHDSRGLVRHFLNQTFDTTYAEIALDSHGFRVKQMEVLYHNNQFVLKPFVMESRKNPTLLEITSDISVFWPGGLWPPRNEPLCGYNGEKRNCDKTSQTAAIVTPLVIFLVSLCLVSMRLRNYLLRQHEMEDWWRVPYSGNNGLQMRTIFDTIPHVWRI